MATVARRANIACYKMLLTASLALLVAATPVAAQSTSPSGSIDGDLARPDGDTTPPPPPMTPPPPPPQPSDNAPAQAPYAAPAAQYSGGHPLVSDPAAATCGYRDPRSAGYQPDDLIGAAEGVFGKGSRGLASLIRDILHKQGAPDGYISGREAGGAFAVGLRYGSGTLCQKMHEPLPVYWTGPSIGFDVGANAAKTFVLVYNLNNPNDLFRRFGAGEGQAYFVGGFNVSYLRRGNVVLIPVRLGVGLRLGINGGYMKISRHQNWLPF